MPKIEINNIYKIFGPEPSEVLPMVIKGLSKEEILEETEDVVEKKEQSVKESSEKNDEEEG